MKLIFKPFSTPRGKYVYDRETNNIHQVSDDEYDAFCRLKKGIETKSDLAILNSFQQKGYFPKPILELVMHPQDHLLDFHVNNKVEKVTMQVTQNCNLRCLYCTYSGTYEQRGHSNKVMSYEVMKRSVDYGMNHSANSKQIDFGFYGGEPLLEFENIKKIVHYIRKNYPYKKVTLSLTTNGTVFTDNIIEFLFAEGFNILVSLDGPKEMHDKNRVFADGQGSYDKLMKNIMYIKDKYPDFFNKISFNTVIAPGGDYKCLSEYFNASDVIGDSVLSTSLVSDFNSLKSIQYDDLYYVNYGVQRTKMLLAALGIISKKEVSKFFSLELPILARTYNDFGCLQNLSPAAHPSGTCIPGARRPFVDTDGNIFPCERVSESSESMRIGSVFTGIDIEKARALLNIGKITEDECKNCWNFIHCTLCCNSADDINELSKNRRLSYCESAKTGTLNSFITICLLRENGYLFEEETYNV